ncbi:autotransporter outer membrane beta-barrel domain-containing protein [Pseudomonas syringae]|nr:autotransporter outer membrane beta-barrel domain-containing protein [Pseudomonas syringae]MCF5066701.1 autotransporter outer membrane beta-barrel domain-containing protein [Pseudomonas syringae]
MRVFFASSKSFRSVTAFYKLAMAPVLMLSTPVMALTTVGPGQTLNIDGTTAPDNYLVTGGALNTTGSRTFEVSVLQGSAITATGGTFAGRGNQNGVTVTNSQATMNDVTVTGGNSGLTFNRLGTSTTGSTGRVTNSVVSGESSGVAITGLSAVELIGTRVTGNRTDSVGLNFFGGSIIASQNSVISGGENGVRMGEDSDRFGVNSLTVDNSVVEGRAGSAIVIEQGIEATVMLQNNALLQSGNGILLEIREASTGTMTVAGSSVEGSINISDSSTANLTFEQGRMTGDVLVDDTSAATVTLNNQSAFTGRLDKVDGVTINSSSTWTLTGNDTIGALAMGGGAVNFGAADAPGTFYQLNVGSLAGTGTFAMKGNFVTGERDFLNVTGVSTGNFDLAVAASGLDATAPQQLTLVHTAAGDAQFSLVNGRPVDVGTFSYELAKRTDGAGGTDWFLDPTTQTVSPGARSVLALFNTAPTVWYGELTSLRSRMGELRFNGGQSGAWMRTYGNKYNVADGSGVGYQQRQQGLSLGADARVGESDVLVGVLAGFSESDLDLNRGTSGTVKSYYFGPYVTWLDADTGYYFDGVLKFNRFRNESKVSLSDGSRAQGDYDNWGVGGSAEFGRHIKLADGYFIEPFTQLSAVQIQGKRYSLNNDMDADGDRTRSLLGKAGATVGRNFGFGNGSIAQPYVRAAIAHEFAKNNEVQVNNNVFNNDLSGTRAEFGAGVAVAMSEQWQVHADFDYANGENIEQPWGANVGVRYSW